MWITMWDTESQGANRGPRTDFQFDYVLQSIRFCSGAEGNYRSNIHSWASDDAEGVGHRSNKHAKDMQTANLTFITVLISSTYT